MSKIQFPKGVQRVNSKDKPKLFWYDYVTVERVIDGDTVVLSIDTGNNNFWRDTFRLFGTNTPEINSKDAVEAQKAKISKGWLEQALRIASDNGSLYVCTHGQDKYGRWLVSLYDEDECINYTMIEAKYAVEYDGGKR